MNITITYETQGSTIAQTINDELSKTNTDWDIQEYPLFKNDRNSFFRRLKEFEIKTDVIIFICTSKFLSENEAYIKMLQKISNSNRYRFIWILTDLYSKGLPKNTPSDVEIRLSQNNIDLDELTRYLKIIEIAVQRRKEKRLKMRKQFNLMFFLTLAYIVIILCAALVISFGDSVLYKSSAELTLTLISSFTAICTVIIILLVFYSIKRKSEREEKKKFSEELDESLSNTKSTVSSTKVTNVLLDIIDKTNKSLFNIPSATLPIETVNSILQIVSQEEKNDNSTYDAVDSEIAHAMGEEEYLPLGHLKFNWKQMKGYYDISKRQATTSFSCAIVICLLGIAIIVFAILSPLVPAFETKNSLIPVIGAIGGAVVEVFAGTILLVYKKSLSQMNLYHKALSEYQRYLSCINLVSKISDFDKQNALLEEIIREEIRKTEIIIDKDLLAHIKKQNNKDN